MFQPQIFFILLSSLLSIVSAKWFAKQEIPLTVKALTPGGNSYDGLLYLHPVSFYDETLSGPKPVPQVNAFDNTTYLVDEFFGNHHFNAPLKTTVNAEPSTCNLIHDVRYKKVNVTLINELIKRNYKVNFFIDNIPIGRELYDSQTKRFYIDNGVPLGYIDSDKIPHIFNHFQFVIYYVTEGTEHEILYATVSTQSLTRTRKVPLKCHLTPPLLLSISDHAYNGNRITYDIFWKEIHTNKVGSSSEIYKNDVVRPFIANSIMLIFTILTSIIVGYTYITIKNALVNEKLSIIHKKRSEASNTSEDEISVSKSEIKDNYDLIDDLEFSWPALLNDVFRTPNYSSVLYFLIGQGCHFTILAAIVIFELSTGIVTVNSRAKSLTKSVHFLFLLTSPIPSLVSSYLLKKFHSGAKNDPRYYGKLALAALLNSATLPIIVSQLVGKVNKAHQSVQSPIFISVDKISALSLSYFFINLVAFVIGLLAWKVEPYRFSEISRKISTLPITFRVIPNMIITGLFPFGVVLIPVSVIYLTLWYNHYYSNQSLLFSFMLLVLLLGSISILNIYYSLSIGNWKWQWYSFLSGISIGFYTLAYSFYLTKLRFGDEASFIIFCSQNFIISSVLGLIGGFVTFTASFFFVKTLYSDMK